MVEEKTTTFMWIEVDLQCPRCRKKIKKLLCKIPQIQDQEYKEKENMVVIKVVCCSPEKIKQKIICKGGDTIKSIEIKPPQKEKPPQKSPEKPPEKDADQPEEKKPPKEDTEPVCVPVRPVGFWTCCTECSEGRDGGPCHYGQGWPPQCYDGYYYGRAIYDSYGGGYSRSCYTYVSRCEETSPGCTIM